MIHLLSWRQWRVLLVALIALVPVGAVAISSFPYSETSFRQSGWTCANGKGTWTVYSSGYCECKINSGISEAWLFSPAVEVKAGYKYKFYLKAEATKSNYPVSVLDFYLLSEASASASPIMQFDRVTTSADMMEQLCEFEYIPEGNATVHFAVLDMTDGSNKGWYSKISEFAITEELNERLPLPVTGLSYTTSGAGGDIVTLSWKNPSADTFGDPLEIGSLQVKRGDDIVALSASPFTDAGAEVSWTDPIPGAGLMEYEVAVIAADGTESRTATLVTDYIGPFAGLPVPYTYSFKDNPFNSMWSLTTEGDSNEWAIDSAADRISVSISDKKPVDATAASPAFILSDEKAYRLRFSHTTYRKANKMAYSLSLVSFGDAMELMPMAVCEPEQDNTPAEVAVVFTPVHSGLNSLAWHATADRQTASYYENTLSISGISLEEIPVVPTPATALEAVPDAGGELKVTLTWTNPLTNETGLPVGNLKATILRNSQEIAVVETAGETCAFTDIPDTPGYHTYSVILSNDAGSSAEEPPVVKSPYVGSPQELPMTADFAGASYMWQATEFGDKANGNIFGFNHTENYAFVSEAGTDFSEMLVSAPYILRAGHTYRVEAECSTSSSSKKGELILIGAGEGTGDEARVLASALASSYSKSDFSSEFFVQEDGAYRFALRVSPDSYGSSPQTFYVKGFTACEIPVNPASPTDLSAVSYYDDTVIDLSFDMPLESDLGMPLSGNLSASVWHGDTAEGEPVAHLSGAPGSRVSWRHTEAVPDAHNVYTVVVSTVGDMGGDSQPVTVKSDWCGYTQRTPFVSDFADETHRGLWTVADNTRSYYNGKTFEWDAVSGNYAIEEKADHADRYYSYMDDWMITPALYMLPEATYEISFEAYSNVDDVTRNVLYAIWVGDTNAPEDLLKGVRVTQEGSRMDVPCAEGQYATYSCTFSFMPQEESYYGAPAKAAEHSRPFKKFIGIRFGEDGKYSYPYVALRSVRVLTDTPTGIEKVVGDNSPAIGFTATEVFVADGTTEIEVYSMEGALVASGKGVVSTETLPHGIYVVRASTAVIKITR